MAQRAESLNPDPTIPARVVAMPEPTPTPIDGAMDQVMNTMDQVMNKTNEVYNNVASKAGETYNDLAETATRVRNQVSRKAENLMHNVNGQLRRTRQENPLMFVAVAAGAGFLLGIALRAWRSSKYE